MKPQNSRSTLHKHFISSFKTRIVAGKCFNLGKSVLKPNVLKVVAVGDVVVVFGIWKDIEFRLRANH